jgi:hypothetical protein
MNALLLAALLGLASCAAERYVPAVDAKVDSVLVAAGIPPLAGRKLKLKLTGPVTIQVGQGNTASQVGTDKTGQRAQAVSTGANSPVTASQKKDVVPWWVFGLVGMASVIGWQWLRHHVASLSWLPWRSKPSE